MWLGFVPQLALTRPKFNFNFRHYGNQHNNVMGQEIGLKKTQPKIGTSTSLLLICLLVVPMLAVCTYSILSHTGVKHAFMPTVSFSDTVGHRHVVDSGADFDTSEASGGTLLFLLGLAWF